MRIGRWNETVSSAHSTRKKTYCRMMGCSLSRLDFGSRLDAFHWPDPVALLVGCEKGSEGVGIETLSEADGEGMASSIRAQVR